MIGQLINRARTAEFNNKITRRLDETCTRGIYQGMKDSQIRKARGLE
jgi:hypothetical protein